MASLHPGPRLRLRRWLLAIAIVLALAAGYAAALQQIAQRVGSGIQDSLRTTPALDDHTPRLN